MSDEESDFDLPAAAPGDAERELAIDIEQAAETDPELELVGDTATGDLPAADSESDAPVSYEAASARLEEIIARLDSGEAELRETLALCTEAKDLIRFCKGELDEVSGELQELELDQLVDELEAP